MRIFAAGIATESNTFCPVPTSFDDFMVQWGKDSLAGRVEYPTIDLSQRWGNQAKARGAELVFSLMAYAKPSGTTVKSVYETYRDEMLRDLQAAMPVEVVLLMMHGAMVAQGYDDCEEDIICRVRDIVGPEAVIGTVLDLHCHLSERMIATADIVITYKEYPHDDINDRARELFELAVDAKLGKVRPTMAMFDCRMIGLYPTTVQPMRAFVDSMMEAEKRPQVLSLSLGHGFQFADVPHVGAKMLAITDNDRPLAQRIAEEFGLRVYALRREIGIDAKALPLDEALSKALAGKKTPVVVADQSDNSGGGAPGDSTFALRWLLDHKASDAAIAILYDPEVVKIARKAGVGATLPVRIGGKMSPASGAPVDTEATVLAIRENHTHAFPQQSGAPLSYPIGDTVALRCGGVEVIVSSRRCQCYGPAIFSDFGIDPKRKRILIPKSTQHFYGAFAPIAGEVIYMAAPGAVAPDPKQITYRRLDTKRLYPWSENPLGT
jgi:microcystin degradation protein MlrC